MTRAVELAQVASLGVSEAFKNRIINGAIGISQRFATGTAVAVGNIPAGTYGPDRFYGYSGTLSLWNIYQVSTGNYDFPFAFRTQRIAGQTSTTASYFGQTIETNNCVGLAGQPVTLSFYATAGANYSGGAATAQILTGTVADQGTSSLNSGTWTGFALPINLTFTPTTTRTRFIFTGTIGATVQEIAFRFNWSGSGTAGANDFLDITGVQLEVGSSATSFEYRPYGTELALCQRYFEILGGESQSLFADTYSNTGNVAIYSGAYNVNKRIAPILTQFGTFTAANSDSVFNTRTSKQGFSMWYGTGGTGRSFWYNETNGGIYATAEL